MEPRTDDLTEGDGDDYTDADRESHEWFWLNVIRPIRRSIVRSLLVGNDTLCFTTAQYADAYKRHRINRSPTDPTVQQGFDILQKTTPEWAAMHLRSTGLVREVQPGVWTINEEPPR